MTWVLLSQDIQGFLELVLLDLAMGGQVTACGAVVHEVVLGEEALRTGVVASGEVYLGQKEGIVCITWASSVSSSCPRSGFTVATCQGKQLVTNVYCGIVLMLAHGVLPPFFEKPLHSWHHNSLATERVVNKIDRH